MKTDSKGWKWEEPMNPCYIGIVGSFLGLAASCLHISLYLSDWKYNKPDWPDMWLISASCCQIDYPVCRQKVQNLFHAKEMQTNG